jgi:hypothetical protein
MFEGGEASIEIEGAERAVATRGRAPCWRRSERPPHRLLIHRANPTVADATASQILTDRLIAVLASMPNAETGTRAASLRTRTQNRQNHLPPETRDRRYTLWVIGPRRQPHADRIGV